jgi:hypothetical protein
MHAPSRTNVQLSCSCTTNVGAAFVGETELRLEVLRPLVLRASVSMPAYATVCEDFEAAAPAVR